MSFNIFKGCLNIFLYELSVHISSVFIYKVVELLFLFSEAFRHEDYRKIFVYSLSGKHFFPSLSFVFLLAYGIFKCKVCIFHFYNRSSRFHFWTQHRHRNNLERKNPDLSSPTPRKSLAECPETSTLMIPLGAPDIHRCALPLLMQLLPDKLEVSE